MTPNETAEIINQEVIKRIQAGFHGDLTIHFNQGIPSQMEMRECVKLKAFKPEEKPRRVGGESYYQTGFKCPNCLRLSEDCECKR